MQAEVRAHFKANPAPFEVELLFWPDITADISQDETLVAKHWKGFPSVAAAGSPNAPWPRDPVRIDRANVDTSEIVECQCEIALQTPGFSDVSPSELATAIQNFARNRPATAGIEIELMMRSAPTRSGATFTWSEHHRECSNVIRKWELEIGDGGFLAFRWSRFTTTSNHRQAMLEVLPLVEGVIVSLRLHRLAIEARTPNPPATLRIRFSCHAEPGPLLLHDDIHATLPFPRMSMAAASPSWSESLEAKWERSSRNVARRTIDRGLSNFTAVPRTPSFGGPVTFVTVNEDIISKIGGTDL